MGNYFCSGRGCGFHAECGGKRCKRYSNLFQFLGLSRDRAGIISTNVAVVEKRILKIFASGTYVIYHFSFSNVGTLAADSQLFLFL